MKITKDLILEFNPSDFIERDFYLVVEEANKLLNKEMNKWAIVHCNDWGTRTYPKSHKSRIMTPQPLEKITPEEFIESWLNVAENSYPNWEEFVKQAKKVLEK